MLDRCSVESTFANSRQQQSKEKAGVLSVNQVELHPWLARPDIVDWCQKRGVVLEAYSPLARASRMDDPLIGPLAKKHNKVCFVSVLAIVDVSDIDTRRLRRRSYFDGVSSKVSSSCLSQSHILALRRTRTSTILI